jgi:hypothetical protein
MRIGKPADRPIDGNELEGHSLRDGHHDLLQLGLGPERNQPHPAAGILRRKMGSFVQSTRGPWIEDRWQDHLVPEAGPVWSGRWFQSLQRIWDDAGADNDM